MVRLIVNADDFGQTRGVTEGILEAHVRGVLTSTTLMANGSAFDFAVAAAKDHPALGVGVHLNFVEGRPVAPHSHVNSLIDKRGQLLSKYALIRRYCSRALRLEDFQREAEAQIDAVIDAGLTPTHVDAHKNIHAFPFFFPAVARAAISRGVRAIRLPYETGWLREAPSCPRGAMRTLLLNSAASWSRQRLKQFPMATTDRFAGTIRTGTIDANWLMHWLNRLSSGSVELMVHPGRDDAELRATGTRLTSQRQTELDALTDRRVIKRVQDSGVELIHFGDLMQPATNSDTSKLRNV